MEPRLRRELSALARSYAKHHGLPGYASNGEVPAVLFIDYDVIGERWGRRHGNFLDASYERITGDSAWAARLRKTHTQRHALPVEYCDAALEPDSCNSSDALLMNVLCYPGVLGYEPMARLLGMTADPESALTFGFRPRVPFVTGRRDSTEVDALLGDLMVEAKLTKTGITAKPEVALRRYAKLDSVFNMGELPHTGDGLYDGYQIIRNVLAAWEHGLRFRLLYDERRPDLIEGLYCILLAMRASELRTRSGAITWQQIAGASPAPLGAFLKEKYGIG